MPDHAEPMIRSGPSREGLLYRVVRRGTRVGLRVVFGARAWGVERVPASGPLLIAANHQSFLDPPFIGSFVTQRPLSYIARAGLFGFRPFAAFITALHAIPLRESSDSAAIKEVLRRLEAGDAVVIFPEGSRTYDGAMGPFKRGVSLLVKRARCPVIPAAVDGVFDAWPRTKRLPRRFGGPIGVRFGEPISHEALMAQGPDAALERLRQEVDALRLVLRADLRAISGGRIPAPGPGDAPAGKPNEPTAEGPRS